MNVPFKDFFKLIFSCRKMVLMWKIMRSLLKIRPTFAYFVLIIIFHLVKYKYWFTMQRTWAPEVAKNREHLFIYNSFIYDQSESAFLTGQKVQLVVLLLAENSVLLNALEKLQCAVDTHSLSMKKMHIRKEIILSLGICALDLFVVTCTLDGLPSNSNLLNDDSQLNSYFLMFRDKTHHFGKTSSTVKLQPMRPSYEKRGLVFCMSRVFLYERWQLLITAIEAYRLFKVDLVVAHVQSALMAVFELMKAYEQSGILDIRPGVRLPHYKDMSWDPNAETEFNGQILLAHECFYEFRESAAFIGLIDWDDLMIPSRHFSTLPAAFAAASLAHPNAAYFRINKLEASFKEQTSDPKRFSLRNLMQNGIMVAEMYNDEKMVVRPKALRGFWMHSSPHLEPNWKPTQLYTNYSLLLHLANDERVDPDDFRVPFLNKFNISKMDMHASMILQTMISEMENFPQDYIFYEALKECHARIFAYYKKTVGRIKPRCLSYSLCKLPRLPEARCAVTNSVFRRVRMKGDQIVIHTREKSYFVKDNCTQRGGI